MPLIEQALRSHLETGTYRTLRASKDLVDFSSNDYLGLSDCGRIRRSLIEDLESGCRLGATGSRLLSGQSECHERVEAFLARTYEAPSALLFGSGYMANLAILTSFGTLGAEFFSDELNHASLIDGMRLTRSLKTVFRHNDLEHLKDRLTKSSSELKVIVTESLFSMEGDLSPLEAMHALAMEHDAWLVVDEAHATGVFGSRGLGRLEGRLGRNSKIVAVHTGGKALGGQGAFVLSSREFRELLVNRARTFIFTTALSPLSALQLEHAVKEIGRDTSRGPLLLDLAQKTRDILSPDFTILRSGSQIIPVIVGSNRMALKAANHLQSAGFDVRAIRSPTVPDGTERLRIALKSFHRIEELERFSFALREAFHK